MKITNKLMGLTISTALFLACMGNTFTAEAADNDMQLGFGHISMQDDISNDEFVVKALYFTLKKEAKRLKNIDVNYGGNSNKPDDFVINVYINKYALNSYWVDPSATTDSLMVWSNSSKWYDEKNKEHTMTTTRYTTVVNDNPGHYNFNADAAVSICLMDAATGEVIVQHDGSERNDKEIDSYTNIVKEFYKKLNKALKEMNKAMKG